MLKNDYILERFRLPDGTYDDEALAAADPLTVMMGLLLAQAPEPPEPAFPPMPALYGRTSPAFWSSAGQADCSGFMSTMHGARVGLFSRGMARAEVRGVSHVVVPLPRCGECGHAAVAHAQGPCEGREGCPCARYVHPVGHDGTV